MTTQPKIAFKQLPPLSAKKNAVMPMAHKKGTTMKIPMLCLSAEELSVYRKVLSIKRPGKQPSVIKVGGGYQKSVIAPAGVNIRYMSMVGLTSEEYDVYRKVLSLKKPSKSPSLLKVGNGYQFEMNS